MDNWLKIGWLCLVASCSLAGAALGVSDEIDEPEPSAVAGVQDYDPNEFAGLVETDELGESGAAVGPVEPVEPVGPVETAAPDGPVDPLELEDGAREDSILEGDPERELLLYVEVDWRKIEVRGDERLELSVWINGEKAESLSLEATPGLISENAIATVSSTDEVELRIDRLPVGFGAQRHVVKSLGEWFLAMTMVESGIEAPEEAEESAEASVEMSGEAEIDVGAGSNVGAGSGVGAGSDVRVGSDVRAGSGAERGVGSPVSPLTGDPSFDN